MRKKIHAVKNLGVFPFILKANVSVINFDELTMADEPQNSLLT